MFVRALTYRNPIIPILLLGLLLGGCEAVSKQDFDQFQFQSLSLTDRPNQFLMSPAALMPKATPHAESPVFQVSAAQLRDAFHKVALAQPRTTLSDETPDRQRARFVQRSLIFRFPDIIDVAFLSPDENTASLQIYSRSVYGYSDWSVNRTRIETWMEGLQSALVSQ